MQTSPTQTAPGAQVGKLPVVLPLVLLPAPAVVPLELAPTPVVPLEVAVALVVPLAVTPVVPVVPAAAEVPTAPVVEAPVAVPVAVVVAPEPVVPLLPEHAARLARATNPKRFMCALLAAAEMSPVSAAYRSRSPDREAKLSP